jgi:Tol biopolymer transport system component
LCVVFAAGCGRFGFGDRDAANRDAQLGDGSVIDVHLTSDGGFCHTGTWGTPQSLGINTTSEERGPSFSSDELTVYFMSNRGGGQARAIWVATRASTAVPFGAATLIAELDSNADDGEPEIAADDLTLYFSSKRVANRDEIYWATRATVGDPWVDQGALVINGDASTARVAPALSPNELTLYYIGNLDLQVATRATKSDTFTWVRSLTELNAAQTESSPTISVDGLEIFFESFRSGPGVIYRAARISTNDTWSAPVALPELAAGGSSWGGPSVSNNGKTLRYYVNLGQVDIYEATRDCL